jgi:pseudouridine kinase
MAELHSLYFYKSLCYNKIMSLTVREQQVLDLIRESPMSSPEDLARRLGISRAAVNVYVGHLTRKGALLGRGYVLPPARAGVVVVGGANMDIKAQITGEVIGATSNPGRASQAPGGVARNVAENLARLGTDTRLITAVGQDPAGDLLLERTAAAGVDVGPALLSPHCATGTYTAVLDAAGELVVAVAAMGVTDELTPEVLRAPGRAGGRRLDRGRRQPRRGRPGAAAGVGGRQRHASRLRAGQRAQGCAAALRPPGRAGALRRDPQPR